VVGAAVGSLVGASEGAGVGYAVGLSVGLTVGSDVGAAVGDCGKGEGAALARLVRLTDADGAYRCGGRGRGGRGRARGRRGGLLMSGWACEHSPTSQAQGWWREAAATGMLTSVGEEVGAAVGSRVGAAVGAWCEHRVGVCQRPST
jgi:phage tail tape-measure protein